MAKTYEEIMDLVGKTAEIATLNTENTAVVLQKLKAQEQLLGGLSNIVDELDKKMICIGNDITQLKLNEEVTTTQQETVIELARKRVLEIIGNDPLEVKKYFKIFIQRLYKDTRKKAA